MTLSSVTIAGPKSLTVGQTADYAAMATYSDGTTIKVSHGVTWSVSGARAFITQSGALSAIAAGTATVAAAYRGVVATQSVAMVVDPSWVSIEPGTSIQSVVNAHPGTTTFYIRSGTHVQQRVVPKSGNTFIGQIGAVLDGQNTTDYAFYSNNQKQTNVTIRNLEIKNYTTPNTSFGAITGHNVSNWVVTDNVVHHNAQSGIQAGIGTGWRVLRNTVYSNGRVGIFGYRCDGALFEGNEMHDNNPSGVIEPGATASASGMKVFEAHNVVIRGNYSHNNNGKGIWSDTNYPTTLIEDNIVANNRDAGIWHEISYAGVIRNNKATGNGHGAVSGSLNGAGIQVTNSVDVEIYGNTVLDNRHGISAMYFTGYPTSGAYGTLLLKNVRAYGNVIRMEVGRTGVATNTGDTSIYTSQGNRFSGNTYMVPNVSGQWFQWQESFKTFSQWKAAGNDVTGTLTQVVSGGESR